MTSLKERLNAYESLMRLKHPVGFLLLLWPSMAALWIASNGSPPFSLILVVFMGCLLFRSAGCALTMWRDPASPVMQGIIASWEVPALAAVLCFFVFCFVWLTTKTAIILFFVTIALIISYVVLRRVILLPQALLGVIFSLGIPFSFAITLDEIPWQAWALTGVNIFWAIAYEIEYSMAEHKDGFTSGYQPPPFSFKQHDITIVAFCYLCFFAGITFFGVYWQWGWPFWLCFAVAVLIALSCLLCIKTRDIYRCVKAFQRNHWLAMALSVGIAADFVVRHHAIPLWNM